MLQELRPAFVMMALMTLLTGIAYPLAITGVAQAVFPDQANGSLVVEDGEVIGSSLIGQSFAGPAYFHPRPSYAGDGYAADSSSGSNLAPTSRELVEAVRERATALSAEAGGRARPDRPGHRIRQRPRPAHLAAGRPVPGRACGRGTRPARRIACATLVDEHTEGRTLGLLGEPRVNVLLLNLALDRMVMDQAGRAMDEDG